MACQLLKGGVWANDAEPTNTVASRRLFTSLCFFMPEQIPLRARERLTFTGEVLVAVRQAVELPLSFANLGTLPLSVTSGTVEPAGAFTLVDAFPVALAAGATAPFRVRPGITGWAQVNGFRGATNGEKMQRRVDHDLYYIDHWSIWFDIVIIIRTVLSRSAYRNAY